MAAGTRKNTGENTTKPVSELLDASLYQQGKGSMEELAAELDGVSDLNQKQIYRHLSEIRSEISGANRFDLAAAIIARVPGLLEATAALAGKIVVDRAAADPRVTAAKAAAASGQVLAEFLQAMADGVITDEELSRIHRRAAEAEAAIEGLDKCAQRIHDEEGC